MIAVGSEVPSVPVKLVFQGEVADTDTGALFAQGVSVMFALPGAFTPTCHNDHLPGYIELHDDLTAAGADRIFCATANDHHVTSAWAWSRGAMNQIEFISDFDAKFAQALDVAKQLPGLGLRYTRSAFIIRDGRVASAFLADRPGQLGDTSAQAVLAVLRSQS